VTRRAGPDAGDQAVTPRGEPPVEAELDRGARAGLETPGGDFLRRRAGDEGGVAVLVLERDREHRVLDRRLEADAHAHAALVPLEQVIDDLALWRLEPGSQDLRRKHRSGAGRVGGRRAAGLVADPAEV